MERRGSRGITGRRVATKSPTRNKSPGRKSPGRKSPGRKSPSRKSPSRKAEPVIKEEPAAAKKRGRAKVAPSQPQNASPKIELQKVSLSPIKHESGRTSIQTKTTTTKTSSSIKVSQISNESDEEIKRLVSQKLSRAEDKLGSLRYTPTPSELSRQTHSRSISRSVVDEGDEGEYSDGETEPIHDEDRNKYNYRTETAKPTTSTWIGLSIFGLILLISLVGFYLIFSCTREECGFSVARLTKLKSIRTYGNWEVCVYYPAYIWAIFLLSALPIGRSKPLKYERPSLSYNFNGLALSVIVGTAVVAAEYLKYPVIRFVYANYQQFCCVAIFYALIVAGWRYIINRNVSIYECNPYAKSGSFWKDYFIGREINPRWLYFDIKLIHYHAAIIATLLLNGIFIYRNLKFSALPTENGNITLSWTEAVIFTYNNVKYDPIALLTACLVFWHALDLLIFEHHITSSFFLQGEGVGAFLLLRNALFPFLNTLISKYAWEHKIIMPKWAIFVTVAVFTIGWFIKRGSNKIKYEFRADPLNPRFNDAETISTYQQRQLLASSYWGLIRQPNYLGEIISYLSLMIPLIWSFAWPPFIAILISIIHLVLRGRQMSIRNFNRYNSSWTRYCQKVRYILIPKVF